MPEALRAADMLAAEWDVAADVWSVTSWSELNRDGVAVREGTAAPPGPDPPARPYVTRAAGHIAGPVHRRLGLDARGARADPAMGPGSYVTLGTDGFGFSDTRPAARRFFNTDAESQVVAVLEALARDGQIDPSVPVAAARQYRIDDVQAAPAQTSDPGPGA